MLGYISSGSRISQRRGRQAKRGGRQSIIWQIFPKNCMKMKKFWARGGRGASLAPPLRSATVHGLKIMKAVTLNSEEKLI